jgi:beta-glucosidase
MKMKKQLILSALIVLSISANAQPKLTQSNAKQVVKAMTLEEKAALLVGFSYGGAYVGMPTAPNPDDNALVMGCAGETAAFSKYGIPHTVMCDGPAGLRISPFRQNDKNTYFCTGFPIGSCLSSTWNTDLLKEVGEALGNEVLEYGSDVILGPGMNIHRNPLCGRNFEYLSEDPVLTGKIAASWIRGAQSNGIGVSAKHFVMNNQETNRMGNNVITDQRTMREIYLKGFEIAVRESSPWTIMSSYNKINGEYTQESHDLLTTILRDEWGFKGMVVTDWTDIRNTSAQIHAGNDLMEPGKQTQINDIIESVKNGKLSMVDVDICAERILQYIAKTPRFHGYKYSNKPDLKAHSIIARKAATEGVVLLKNDNMALPLTVGTKKVALFGTASYKTYAGGTGSGDVNKPYVININKGLENAGYELDSAIQKMYATYENFGNQVNNISLEKYGFFKMFMPRKKMPEPALNDDFFDNYAKNYDVAIITIGRSSGEGSDRNISDFNLSDNEKYMIKGVCSAFHAKNKKVVVVLNIGGVVETKSWSNDPDAILLAWQPGEEAGNAIADILSGKVSPSGKLPDTFPVSINDVPSTANFPTDYKGSMSWDSKQASTGNVKNVDVTDYAEGINVGYRYFVTSGKQVSYPFGYGLSYTTFSYSNAKIQKKDNKYVATVTVKNDGEREGKEIVELYITAPKSNMEKPAKELKAFAKTRTLKPGESQVVAMTFTNYDLASYDITTQSWITDAGQYKAKFAASSADIRETVSFNAKKQIVKCHDVLGKK